MVSKGPNSSEEEILARHAAYLKGLTEQGTVLVFGRTQVSDEGSFGVVIFRAKDIGEARRIMERDPAVESGIMRTELYPYRVSGLAQSW